MSENKCFPAGVDIKKTIDLYSQVKQKIKFTKKLFFKSNKSVITKWIRGGVPKHIIAHKFSAKLLQNRFPRIGSWHLNMSSP